MTVEQAKESLLAFMSELDGETRSMKKREITEVFTLGGFNETRAIGLSEDTPLVYLFNFADDRGYALMSGDTRVGDVLAFVEKGNSDPQEGTDNPGLAIFLSDADTYYRLRAAAIPNMFPEPFGTSDIPMSERLRISHRWIPPFRNP